MSDFAIKVQDLSKLYQLGQIGTGTLHRDIKRWWYKVRDKEDPFMKIGQENDRTKKSSSDLVWALKDINFEVKSGEVLGIIGRNGAGKSTLLKILSKITSPTKGEIHVNGRIASLLEVGTGFHPELTGKENIFLNGAILGMKKWEIKKKFDEIVDFAGVEAYIDTPVKRYSSGMYVRLAFAVAAFLEPEILIVDEVLAVGDAEFQKKCLGRMKDVSQNDGRTVLFVSHNLGAVASLCQKGLLLSNGTMVYHGEVEDALSKYAKLNKSVYSSIDQVRIDGPLRKSIYFKNILINGADPYKEGVQITPDSEILIEIHSSSTESDSFRLIMGLIKEGVRILSLHDTESYVHTNGDFISKFKLPASFLRPGIYSVGIGTHSSKEEWSWSENVFEFDIIEKYDQINERRNFGLVNVKPLSFSERIIG